MTQVLEYQWEWQAIPGYFLFIDSETGRVTANILLKGFGTTVKLSIWSMALGFVLGTFSGIMGAKGGSFGRMVSRFYVETVRNIPSLVLVILFYYFVSSQFLEALGWINGSGACRTCGTGGCVFSGRGRADQCVCLGGLRFGHL